MRYCIHVYLIKSFSSCHRLDCTLSYFFEIQSSMVTTLSKCIKMIYHNGLVCHMYTLQSAVCSMNYTVTLNYTVSRKNDPNLHFHISSIDNPANDCTHTHISACTRARTCVLSMQFGFSEEKSLAGTNQKPSSYCQDNHSRGYRRVPTRHSKGGLDQKCEK